MTERSDGTASAVRSIATNDELGAAALSLRAVETLRDRAAELVDERDAPARSAAERMKEADALASLAKELCAARPAMAVLRNRVNRTMAEAAADDGDGETDHPPDAAAVRDAARSVLDRARDADADAAAATAERIEGAVLTLSRSGTVADALRAGDPSRIFVAESRPAREGIDAAEALAADAEIDAPVTVHTDAAAAHVLAVEEIDRVVVGADAVLPSGAVVNKTGTRTTAIAAVREGVPVTVAAAVDKVSTREAADLEFGDADAVYDGNTLGVLNPTFDVTPAACVDEIVTERGGFTSDQIAAVAAELQALADWDA